MLRIVMKNFLGKVSDNLICQLVILPLSHEAHELRQWLGQIILVVKQINDFGGVLVQHILYLTSVFLHTHLHHVEQRLLNFLIFDIVWIFEHVKACLDKQIHKILIDLMIREKSVYIGIKKREKNFEAFFLRDHNRILLELTRGIGLVILPALALGANILGVLELTVVTHEPSDQVSVRLQRILDQNYNLKLHICHLVLIFHHMGSQKIVF